MATTTALRPQRGGFIRPFGCGWFIREFLAGQGPEGSSVIDPARGAPQTDIHSEYKAALHRAWAEDLVAREAERRIAKGLPALSIAEADELTRRYMERIPIKFTRARYHSFVIYFGVFKRLGWVEATGETEPSEIQGNYPPAPPRTYYRLTVAGQAATDREVGDPLTALYGYDRQTRSARNHQYTAKGR